MAGPTEAAYCDENVLSGAARSMPTLNWDDLRFVLAIAEAGSLTRATRVVGASQPTVSRRLAALEEALEVKLFERRQEGYRLTKAGERLRAHAQRMEVEARQIERDLGAADEAVEGRVVLAATEDFAIACITPMLGRFHCRYPRLAFDMVVSYDAIDLMRREADFAVRIGDPRSDRLESLHVGKLHFGIYGSADYLARNGEPRHLEDLASHAVIGSIGRISEFMQTRLFQRHASEATVAITSDNLMSQLAALRAGFGLLAMPSYLTWHAPEARRVLADQFDPSLDVWLLTHKDIVRTGRIRALSKFLAEEIADALARCRDPRPSVMAGAAT